METKSMTQGMLKAPIASRHSFTAHCKAGKASRGLVQLRSSAQRLQVSCAQKGFGADTSKFKKKQRKGSSETSDQGWTPVAKDNVFQGKQIKAVEVKGKTILALYNVNGSIYCSDANSTAYQFPLTNGKILQREGGPAVEVALDGTIYDLKSGKVLEWCPRNNPFRAVLGTLKGNQVPKNLNVYPARLDEESGQILVQLD